MTGKELMMFCCEFLNCVSPHWEHLGGEIQENWNKKAKELTEKCNTNNWVSVEDKEKKPKDGQVQIIQNLAGYVTAAVYRDWPKAWQKMDGSVYPIDDIEYWQPLPKARQYEAARNPKESE